MILAVWFKNNLKQALLNQVYSDKSKVNGVNVDDPAIKEKIYQQYLQAYKKGVFNYIKEEVDQSSQQIIPRKYFSGGIRTVSLAMLSKATPSQAMRAIGDQKNGDTYLLSGITVGAPNPQTNVPSAAMTAINFSDVGKARMRILQEEHQSMWLDFISRDALGNGQIQDAVTNGVLGMTSNPAIFEAAIRGSNTYDADIKTLAAQGLTPKGIYEKLAVKDIQAAADILLPVYQSTSGNDGFISLEIDPNLADDRDASIEEGIRLWEAVRRPNLMIKVPVTETEAGYEIVTALIARGINVNVTTLFSPQQYEKQAKAVLEGLDLLAEGVRFQPVVLGRDIRSIRSVASFFVSRVDTAVDPQINSLAVKGNVNLKGQLGKAAIANATIAYGLYKRIFSGSQWNKLQALGAVKQRVLWASTGVKDPSYSPTMYVTNLIADEPTVNTAPPATIQSFLDSNEPIQPVLTGSNEQSRAAADIMGKLETAGIDMKEVFRGLTTDAKKKFVEPFNKLLAAIQQKSSQAMTAQTDTGKVEVSDQVWRDFINKTLGQPDMPAILEKHKSEMLNATTFKDFLRVILSIRVEMEYQTKNKVFQYLLSGPTRTGVLDLKTEGFLGSALLGSRASVNLKDPIRKREILAIIDVMLHELGTTVSNGEILKLFLSHNSADLRGLYVVTDQAMTSSMNWTEVRGDIEKWLPLAQQVSWADINEDMFRDYDYRYVKDGVALKPEIVFILSLVWAKMALKKAEAAGITTRDVLVARDARKIEPEIADAEIAALRYAGLNVVFVGDQPNCVTSYSWAVQSHEWLMTIFNTASHVAQTDGVIETKEFSAFGPEEGLILNTLLENYLFARVSPEKIMILQSMEETKEKLLGLFPKEKVQEILKFLTANMYVRGFKVTQLGVLGGNVLSLTTKEIKNQSKAYVKEFLANKTSIENMATVESGKLSRRSIEDDAVSFNTAVGLLADQDGSLYQFGQDIKHKDAEAQVKSKLDKFGKNTPLAGLRVVVEGSHTPSGPLAERVFRNLGAKVEALNLDVQEVSGLHKADPSIDKNLEELKKKIIETHANFGIAFDLDGDRGAILIPEWNEDGVTVKAFHMLAPDNILGMLMPYLLKNWGYTASGKKVGVIRDVLGTYGVNDAAKQNSVSMFQTDAGYVYLKAKKEEMERQGYVFPVYGERSGHTWLNVSGEIENPVAVAVLFSIIVAKHKDPEDINGVLNLYKESSIPYSQSPRFQPFYQPRLLQWLSDNNDLGWKYVPGVNPPAAIVALGKDETVKRLSHKFSIGATFGEYKVTSFNTYQDPVDEGGLYRFADIMFEKNGQFVGRVVVRASSNDPTFVMSYEAPVINADVQEARL